MRTGEGEERGRGQGQWSTEGRRSKTQHTTHTDNRQQTNCRQTDRAVNTSNSHEQCKVRSRQHRRGSQRHGSSAGPRWTASIGRLGIAGPLLAARARRVRVSREISVTGRIESSREGYIMYIHRYVPMYVPVRQRATGLLGAYSTHSIKSSP